MKTTLLLTTALLITTGCNEKKKKEIKQEASAYTVQYYLDHEDLMERDRPTFCVSQTSPHSHIAL